MRADRLHSLRAHHDSDWTQKGDAAGQHTLHCLVDTLQHGDERRHAVCGFGHFWCQRWTFGSARKFDSMIDIFL